MSDVPYSVRIEPEVRDKLSELIEQSGLSAKDFVTRLVDSYEISQTRETLGQIKELDTLRHHLARIEEIYIAITKSSQDKASADVLKIAELEDSLRIAKAIATDERENASKTIKEVQSQIDSTRAEAALLRESAEKELAVMRETLGRALDSQEQASRLATLAEKASRDSEEKAARLEAQANQAAELQQRLDTLTNEYNELMRRLSQSEDTIARLKESLETEKKTHDEILAKALADAAKLADLEKREALLEIQKNYISENSSLREQLAKTREEKAALEVQLVTRNE